MLVGSMIKSFHNVPGVLVYQQSPGVAEPEQPTLHVGVTYDGRIKQILCWSAE